MQSYVQRETLTQANSNMAECLFSSVDKPGPTAEQVGDHWIVCNMQQPAAYAANKNNSVIREQHLNLAPK